MSENEVELEALNPEDFSAPKDRLEDHLVQAAPIVPESALRPKPDPDKVEPVQAVKLAEKTPDDPLARAPIDDSLVNKLMARFNRVSDAPLRDIPLLGDDGASLVVSVRDTDYRDTVWAMSVMENWIQANKNVHILTSDISRRAVLGHLASVACIVKIDGEWIWDVTEHTAWLLENIPSFNNDYKQVPELILSQISELVFELLQTLHPTLIFQLQNALEKEEEKKEEVPDPSLAT